MTCINMYTCNTNEFLPNTLEHLTLLIYLQVLSVDYQNKKLTLSRKKALMETSLPLFLTYKDARVGLVSHGFIVCIKDFGCIVRFLGEVKGLVPTSELTSETTDRPQSLFYIGQVRKLLLLASCFLFKHIL